MPTTVTKYSSGIPVTQIVETKTTTADNGELIAETKHVVADFYDHQLAVNYLATLATTTESN